MLHNHHILLAKVEEPEKHKCCESSSQEGCGCLSVTVSILLLWLLCTGTITDLVRSLINYIDRL